MLEQNLCRVGAYKQFHRLVNEKKLTHMGPAYFTKLIYFLGSKQNGYIMDQWTARSMNLLRKCDKYKIRLYAGAKRKCDGYRYFWELYTYLPMTEYNEGELRINQV